MLRPRAARTRSALTSRMPRPRATRTTGVSPPSSSYDTRGNRNYGRGHPDPHRFAGQYVQPAHGEKPHAYWRNFDRPPGEKVAMVGERGQECDATASVSQRIEQTVRGGDGSKPDPE